MTPVTLAIPLTLLTLVTLIIHSPLNLVKLNFVTFGVSANPYNPNKPINLGDSSNPNNPIYVSTNPNSVSISSWLTARSGNELHDK